MVKKITTIWSEIVSEGRWFTISNMLTVLRIFLVPFIVMGIFYNSWFTVFWLLALAGLTDVLDGHIARWLNEQTRLGACLDPLADKLLLISSFTALSCIDSPSFSIPLWFVCLLFMRELIIIGGSFFLMLIGVNFTVTPSVSGKLTTFFQLSFIFWIFICYFAGWSPLRTYSVVLVLLALFSLGSLIQYSLRGVRYLRFF